ncbi:hypothetical protein HGRIS_001697 [Hohenbuehelia grisea]|uniref:F-box domain-containing protein n=1 Tax=Hohenbuehelia grisea TaxID=104357 RepID=A0ABR3JJ11_9AGAR
MEAPNDSTLEASHHDGRVDLQPVENEIEAQELEIVRRQKLLYGLKSKRNALLPVARLPTDVLCFIFQIAQDDVFSTESWYNSLDYRRFFKWVSVTHVCTTWRDAGLGCAPLWRRILIRYGWDLKWLDAFLLRARTIPLDLGYWDDPYIEPRMSAELSRRSYRARKTMINLLQQPGELRAITLIIRQGTDMAAAISHITQKLGRLENLTLAMKISASHPLSPDFFASKAPRLRTLDLTNCALKLASPIVTTASPLLTRLHLSVTTLHSVHEITQALKRMPNLEDLVLNNCFTPSSPFPASNDTPILLAKLQRITVQSPYYSSFGIFDLLRHPNITHVIISAESGEATAEQDNEATAVGCIVRMLAMFKAHHPKQVYSAELAFNPDEGVSLILNDDFNVVGRINLACAIYLSPPRFQHPSSIYALCAALPDITALSVQGSSMHDQNKFMERILGGLADHARKVEELTAYIVPALGSLLRTPAPVKRMVDPSLPTANSASATSTIDFPCLRRLRIEESSSPDKLFLPPLTRFLMGRVFVQKTIERLEVYSGRLSGGDIRVLECLVDDLDVERGDDEEEEEEEEEE